MQESLDAQFQYLGDAPDGFIRHLEELRESAYADMVDIIAASILLGGSIQVYRPDAVGCEVICDITQNRSDVKMIVAWVHHRNNGNLNHFELWTPPDEVEEAIAALP